MQGAGRLMAGGVINLCAGYASLPDSLGAGGGNKIGCTAGPRWGSMFVQVPHSGRAQGRPPQCQFKSDLVGAFLARTGVGAGWAGGPAVSQPTITTKRPANTSVIIDSVERLTCNSSLKALLKARQLPLRSLQNYFR
jgi:hypothetical protein